MMRNLRNALFIVLLTAFTSACAKEPNPFEVAKAHVWGDAMYGCDYQKVVFKDNIMTELYSKQALLDRVKANPKLNVFGIMGSNKIKKIEVYENTFILYIGTTSDIRMMFKIKKENLKLIGHYTSLYTGKPQWHYIYDKNNNNRKPFPIIYKKCN